jgi:hypothetical protein
MPHGDELAWRVRRLQNYKGRCSTSTVRRPDQYKLITERRGAVPPPPSEPSEEEPS